MTIGDIRLRRIVDSTATKSFLNSTSTTQRTGTTAQKKPERTPSK
jgi:hypothetical protein